MYFIAKLGAVGAVGFASTTGASAQAMEAATRGSDFLLMEEAPLTTSELQEARGGFSFGGFDFDFGIEIAPIQPIPEGGLFGADGVFGPGGVFGENGGPGNQATDGNSSSPSPAVNNAPSPSPVVNNAPSPSPAVNNAPSPSPAVNNAPSPVVNNTPSPSPVVNNAPAAPQSPTPASQNVVQPANSPTPNNSANTGGGNAQSSDNTSGPSMSLSGVSQNVVSRVTQTIASDGRTVIIDNNMNGVRLQQTIDFNVRVLNFDARINRAIADSVTATLASRNLILNAATNN